MAMGCRSLPRHLIIYANRRSLFEKPGSAVNEEEEIDERSSD
jgi:hypothetical protein